MSRRRAAVALALAVAALLAVAATPRRASAFDLCGAARAAGFALPAASPADPLVQTAQSIFDRLYRPFYAASFFTTEFTVIAPTARVAGAPLPPYAAMCATTGAPRLYVTHALLELLRDRNLYDESFLAVIFGHELGHRLRHFDRAGKWLPPKWTKELEEVADVHGAFLAASTGFATRHLACDDIVDLFLNVEAAVPDDLRQGRKAALGDVLRAFDVYESAYDAASALLFSDAATAVELTAWLNEHMKKHARPVGEMLVLEALARTNAAIPTAYWQQDLDVPGAPVASLRCLPVYPSHTSFWDPRLFDEAAGARGPSRGPMDKDLMAALALLTQAESLGVHEVTLASARACVSFYGGDYAAAKAELAKAEAAAADSPKAVKEALRADAALFAWATWVHANKPPEKAAPEAARRDWGKALAAASGGFTGHDALAAWLGRVRAYPKVAAVEAAATPFVCLSKGGTAAEPGPSFMPPLPRAARSGGCPCGWTLLHELHMSELPEEGTLTTCVPAGWGVGMRWVRFLYPFGGDGSGTDLTLMLHDALRGPLARATTWGERCDRVEPRGATDSGARVLAASCPAIGAARASLLVDDGCRVQRAVVVSEGP
ncbi:MAG: hypothetical protein H6745_31565 [Deltaproteobacteria bacterium]|nr:hypothetical protein [Deltaproteobacteria bacterium]